MIKTGKPLNKYFSNGKEIINIRGIDEHYYVASGYSFAYEEWEGYKRFNYTGFKEDGFRDFKEIGFNELQLELDKIRFNELQLELDKIRLIRELKK